MQLPSQQACKFCIGHWVRSSDVHRAPQLRSFQGKQNRPDDIREADPAHPLPSVAQARAQSGAKRWEHLLQRALSRSSSWSQHDSEAKMHDANAGLNRRLSRSFPLPAETGEKAGAQRRRFREHFVSATSVDADSRCHQKRFWRLAQRTQHFREAVRGIDPARSQFAFVCIGPTVCGHAGAGEMNRRRSTFEGSGTLDGSFRDWIPLQLSFGRWNPS